MNEPHGNHEQLPFAFPEFTPLGLTRADVTPSNGSQAPVDMAAWVAELEELRSRLTTGKPGPTSEQILEEDRANRV